MLDERQPHEPTTTSDGTPSSAVSSLPRVLARLSIVSAFACFTFNCVASQLSQRHAGGLRWLLLAASVLSTAIVIGGVGLGGYAVWTGLRKRDTDTWMIGPIGLLMNLGILFVMGIMMLVLRS